MTQDDNRGAQLAAWIQVIIGVAGLFVAVRQGGPALDAIAAITSAAGSGLPPEFAGSQGALRVFLFMLVLIITGTLALVGLGVIMSAAFRRIGARHPYHSAFFLIAAVIFTTSALTTAIFEQPLWVLASLMALLMLTAAAAAGISEDISVTWGTAGGGLIPVAVAAAIGTAIVMPSAPPARSAVGVAGANEASTVASTVKVPH